jgi:hypothetical protein
MKTNLFNSKKIHLLIVSLLLINVYAFGTSFTAVTSGNWSSALTWGGTAPPFTLGATDQVTIGSGITVTMDSSVNINGLLAQVSVAGTLTSAANNLTVTSGTLTGTGTIVVNDLTLAATGTFSFTGTATANVFNNSIASLTTTAKTTVNKMLNLMGIISIQTGGNITMGSLSVINVSGAQIDLSGGTLGLSSTYDVNYISGSASTGMELSGTGLRKVTINVTALNSVTLGSNLATNDSLKMVSGALTLNGYGLTINKSVSGAGTFTGDASANITVNTPGGIAVPLSFTSGSEMLNNLTVNVGSGNSLALGSALTVSGTLNLVSGSKFDISGMALTMSGNFSGTGSIVVNPSSSVTINPVASITTPIPFSGSSMANFTLNAGGGNTVTLGSNLAVSNTLSLQSGTLVLNGNNLSIMGGIAASGSGLIASSASSDITVSSAVSPSGTISFQYPNNIVNNFNVGIGAAGSVTLASDIVIQGTLNFMSGHVDVGANNMQIGAAGSITGANSNAYVITETGGYLTMNATLSGPANFPVGTASSYFPATITLNPGSATGTVGVNVSSGVYSQGTSGALISNTQPLVNATWLYQTSIVSGLSASMQLMWSPATEVNGFIHTGDFISHYNGTNWDVSASMTAMASGGMFTITRANITSFSPYAVFDQSTLGINELVDNEQFEVYPNPATDNLYIKTGNGFNGLVNADIFNILGQVVESFTITNNSKTIPLSGLDRGNYFIKLYNSDISVVKKFVKL